jgi:hypothetical protein
LGVVVEVHCLFSQEVVFEEIVGHVVEIAGEVNREEREGRIRGRREEEGGRKKEEGGERGGEKRREGGKGGKEGKASSLKSIVFFPKKSYSKKLLRSLEVS